MTDYEGVSIDQKQIDVPTTVKQAGVYSYILSLVVIGLPVVCLFYFGIGFKITLLVCLVSGFAQIVNEIAQWSAASNAQVAKLQDTLMTRLPKI